MPSKPVFPIRTLFRELELRFSRTNPMPTSAHLGYYLAFLLLDHPIDETWMLLLDARYRLVKSIQCTEGILEIETMLTIPELKDKRVRYFCLAHTHSEESTEPSGIDRGTHNAISTHYAKDPEYLGCFILNQALDYCFLPPTTQGTSWEYEEI